MSAHFSKAIQSQLLLTATKVTQQMCTESTRDETQGPAASNVITLATLQWVSTLCERRRAMHLFPIKIMYAQAHDS